MAKTNTEDTTIKAPADPMKDMVSVYLPRATGKEQNFVFVGLNGKGYKIQRGRSVMVPRPVANILWESERRRRVQEDYDREAQEKANRPFNP